MYINKPNTVTNASGYERLSLKKTLRLNYYRVMLFYYITVSFIGGLIIYGAEKSNESLEGGGISFIDALFTSSSCVCAVGLMSADFSRFRTGKLFDQSKTLLLNFDKELSFLF